MARLCAFHLDCELSPEEIIADFRTFYYETALSGFETNLIALENFVQPDHILFGTDFPAVSPQTAGWYTNNVDTYFEDRPDLLTQVMHGNAHTLLPRLAATTVGERTVADLPLDLSGVDFSVPQAFPSLPGSTKTAAPRARHPHQHPAVIYRGTTSHTRARRQLPVDLVLVDSPAGPETPFLWSDSVRATARNRASQ